ncbi:homeobox domain-containing protein [Colletotrichum orchidophilum]|uniref:Homeobox domain-containing protein n=1 Tax=Colletotrichum orchidophilum TaxID=1209926 RepID=A0A1G4BIE0_9PEZI|nr:homeobox domain-containing protein [Colletotrichum orchidophilum]OHF01068.1 homeobox domain-containing protein [Colletotrichum orchidophilum]
MAFYPNYHTATAYEYGFSTPFPGAPLYQNDYMEMFRQQQQQAMMSRGLFPAAGGKATESKPRLAKDEVDKLEREFQKNNKPNSSLKKQLAEEMRVDIARINNWFQNRRAKAKQEKRTQENEARRKSDQATETPNSSETIKESFHDHDDDLRPSAAPFPPVHVSADASSISETSPTENIQTPEPSYEQPQVVTQEPESEYASPDSSNSFQHQDLDISYSLGPDQFYTDQTCDFSASMPTEVIHQTPGHLTLSIPSQYLAQLPESTSASSFSSYHLHSASDMDESLASFSHSLSANLTSPIPISIKQEQMQREDLDKFDQFSPQSMSQSPPEISTPDFRLKSTSTIDIASRRNSKRPATLVSCVRSQSYNYSGPKTGIEMPRRMEAPSPMRRVASATGNFPRGIQKTAGAGPRSPLYFDRNQENLILQMASRSPASRSPAAPPTPNTPIVPSQQAMRETTVSSMSSAEDDKSYSTQNSLTVPQYAMDPTMRTPPDTPGMMTTMPNSLFPAFDFNVSDDPLSTPSFGSFDQEFPNMSASVPSYVAHSCASQPVTPSFPPSNMGPAFYSSYGGGNTEYNWSDASSVLVKPSPEQSRSRQFQFTNMTAQDFHGE